MLAGNWTTLLRGTIILIPFMVRVPPLSESPKVSTVVSWMYPAWPNPAGTLELSTVS